MTADKPYTQYAPRFCACGCGGRPRNFYAEYIAGHRPKQDPTLRFWRRVKKTESCWLWSGAIGSHGYGTYWDGSKFVLAHRYSLLLAGRLVDELQVDHLCRVRPCVNPDHLEPVTSQVNIQRAMVHRKQKSHCKRGHDFAETGFLNSKGYRECAACGYESRRRRHAAK